ncbi:uncharacterized protein MELLADRAFT_106305 [Melampsora larici-populina 98AG31]|uniref:Alpha-type protein kinase domain-containing protein n=1 Tax=Melampsora larici-populina (strain 98AG31 / pathotype 3-4-7) TaxID=747676 RepID=F4RKY1_MELLP|nr:uncharacterized protein MELLADRAFT_106305 [Melampsora larici-populina 98AG31]EGG06803.1 hypothetical protein MELLADRAFT_106305 [Melampsora larici-populina 98AG31]
MIENLGRKEEGCVYRLKAGRVRKLYYKVYYDQDEDVEYYDDHITYKTFELVKTQAKKDGWTVRRIYVGYQEPCYVLQGAGSTYEAEPRWKILDGATDRSHTKPDEPNTWTRLIHAFIHYTYDLSGNQTLISHLDCDEHGKISNSICYDQNCPPYHSRDKPEMKVSVERAFKLFREQHVCNDICGVIGNVKMGPM